MSDLQPLRAMLRDMPTADAMIAEWRGGPRENGGVQSPYPEYGPVIDRLWAAFAAAGFPEMGQQDYMAVMSRWRAAHAVQRVAPAHVGQMDRETCFNLLREIQRSERFCDGAWLGAWREGLFHAVAERLVALGDDS